MDVNDLQGFIVTIYTENHIGILNRIAVIFSRRRINIETLSIYPSEISHMHRFDIYIQEDGEVVRKLTSQLEKQVEVFKAYYNVNGDEKV